MGFIQVNIKTDSAYSDIFIAELGEIGFDTFEELEDGLSAFVDETQFDETALNEIIARYKDLAQPIVTTQRIEKENWNEQWEKNYDPIEVEDQCIVRATFHQIEKKYPFEIVINPKMSFGTGHHATTWQMLKLELDLDFKGKNVLDLGTGTGILAIMAGLLGADYIEATDIDEWCIENSRENFQLNNFTHIGLKLGAVTELSFDRKFEIVLANINKNVLLEEIAHYHALMVDGGHLLLSGFYEQDIADLEAAANKLGLELEQSITRNDWAALILRKK